MKLVRIAAAVLLGTVVSLGVLGAVYQQFSPGGALSGSWNSQNVNVGAGGSFITGTLPAGNGGTGQTAVTDDTTLIGNGTVFQAKAVPNCGDSSHALAYATSTNTFSCQAISGSGVSQTASTVTLNLTGCTTVPTVTLSYVVTGSTVTLMPQTATGACTSNATSFGVAAGGLPASIRPARTVQFASQSRTDNGTTNAGGCVSFNADGSITFHATVSNASCDTNTWTGSNSKGFWTGFIPAYSYPLN